MLRILRAQNFWSPIGHLPTKHPWRITNPKRSCPSSLDVTIVAYHVVTDDAVLRHGYLRESDNCTMTIAWCLHA